MFNKGNGTPKKGWMTISNLTNFEMLLQTFLIQNIRKDKKGMGMALDTGSFRRWRYSFVLLWEKIFEFYDRGETQNRGINNDKYLH